VGVVTIGTKRYQVVHLIRDPKEDTRRWAQEPTIARVLPEVRDYLDKEAEYSLTDYRLIKVQSTAKPGWFVFVCTRHKERLITQIGRDLQRSYAEADDIGMLNLAVIPKNPLHRRPPKVGRDIETIRANYTRADLRKARTPRKKKLP
jgi:hypothetical protein